jgi:hypothetical protein
MTTWMGGTGTGGGDERDELWLANSGDLTNDGTTARS